ncbi:uncharacterized protein LOC126106413 [Schistocerca cancellata]|uniref:uncharacterized protein LOC126106413 n=1 Tax=Schistocerca cancellata TaxID=274614 RepID=UPI0021193FA9|nr:uncharacterized protein LOC126106413 [Schistocerca cancellata]
MHPGGVATSLLAILAANGTAVLDCVCTHVQRRYSDYGYGGQLIFGAYCREFKLFDVSLKCETLQRPTIAVQALLRVLPSWTLGPRRLGYGECEDALAVIRGLTNDTAESQFTRDLRCFIADDCIDSCSVLGLNDTEWNVETLETDLREPILSQLLHAVRRITKAIKTRRRCAEGRQWNFLQKYLNKTEFQAEVPVYLEHLSSYTRDAAQLLSVGVTTLSQLFIPLAFKLMEKQTNDTQLQGWINNMEHLRDMLDTKLWGWVQDMERISEQIANYKVEEDVNKPGKYIIRLPLLNDHLLSYHGKYLSFRDDFTAQCQEQQPEASVMFGLADALYGFYRRLWFEELQRFLPSYERPFNLNNPRRHYARHIDIIGEEWQLEDKSNATISVDAGCLELLVSALDHPTCPLEDLPPETIEQREQCRVQLWNDLVRGSTHVPETSHRRANVSLCLLAWMAANSSGICQHVPFSMVQSVDDARCAFDSPDDQSCPKSNTTDAICSVSRALLLLKCRDFSSHTYFAECGASMDHRGWYSPTRREGWERSIQPPEILLTYKNDVNNVTLK